MKLVSATLAAPALLAVTLLAGCGKSAAPDTESSASATATEPKPLASASLAAPIASEPAAPPLKAASYPPRDECMDLPGWPEFRSKLESAVATRDADALAALTDPAVKLDFGGGFGVKEMRLRLRDKDYKLWDALAALLPLGCAAEEGGATMPWIFARAPEDVDAYSGMLALGPDVPAYTKPDAGTEPFTTLNWALVNSEQYEEPKTPFALVTLPSGKKAYIETARLRSIIDYRLLASRTKQGWRIDGLLAGD